MKLLEGHVKNRTKEAALAAMFIALFFVTRTFKIQVLPFYLLDLGGIFLFTPVLILSWQYTILLSLAGLYGGSTIVSVSAWLTGTQVIFFLSKLVGKKYAVLTIIPGELVAWLTYGLALQAIGMMNLKFYIITTALPELAVLIVTTTGVWFTLNILRRFEVID